MPTSPSLGFIKKLQQRNVLRVGAMYVVASWVLVQVGDVVAAPLSLPAWFQSALIAILGLGFPITLVLAWIFDVTAEGIVRSTDDSAAELRRLRKRHKIDYAVIGTLIVAIGLMFLQRRDVTDDVVPADSPPLAGSTARKLPAIAVLPFVDLSREGDQAYFSEGVSEEILNVLAGVGGLQVASRTSSFAFTGKERSVPDIADLLQVDYVLEGSVRRAGSQVRVTAQLIDAHNDRHLWSESYNEALTVQNLFAVQDRVANSIVTALRDRLRVDATVAETTAIPTENIDAYELYLQALRVGWTTITGEGTRLAVGFLERAVEIDPNFAKAWGRLGFLHFVETTWYADVDRSVSAERARFAAERALAIDSSDAYAHAALAQIAQVTNEWEKAEYHNVFGRGATLRLSLGDLTGALRNAELRLANDPLFNFTLLNKGLALIGLSCREEGLEALEQAVIYGYGGSVDRELLADYATHGQQLQWATLYQRSFQPFANVAEVRPLFPHIKALVFSREDEQQAAIERFWTAATQLGYERDSLLRIGTRETSPLGWLRTGQAPGVRGPSRGNRRWGAMVDVVTVSAPVSAIRRVQAQSARRRSRRTLAQTRLAGLVSADYIRRL